ncbi:MAG: HPr family phosphocarrier protein [Herbinix sp.]|nr:HPr family phosphocarrier protein [Herbinix sp.]
MVSRKLVINNPLGLHLRPITVLCNRSFDFKSTITIKIGDKSVDAKSVIGVLSACVKQGDEIELICEGTDEVVAADILSNMIQNGLGDEYLKK